MAKTREVYAMSHKADGRCTWWRHERDNDNIVHIVDSPQVCGKILVESSHAQLNTAVQFLVSPTCPPGPLIDSLFGRFSVHPLRSRSTPQYVDSHRFFIGFKKTNNNKKTRVWNTSVNIKYPLFTDAWTLWTPPKNNCQL